MAAQAEACPESLRTWAARPALLSGVSGRREGHHGRRLRTRMPWVPQGRIPCSMRLPSAQTRTTSAPPTASMRYETRVVCFLDILGFGALVDKTVDTHGAESASGMLLVADALRCLRTLPPNPDGYFKSRVVTHFSDSAIISFAYNEESGVFFTLLDLLHLQMELVAKGVLCRGGVAMGHLHHDGDYVFGPALNAAYKLESKVARYPRIIVSEDVITCGATEKARHNTVHHELREIMDMLKHDDDDQYYLDYLLGAQGELDDPEDGFPGYLGHIAKILTRDYPTADESIRCKLDWLVVRYSALVDACRRWAHAEGKLYLQSQYDALPTKF